MHYILPLILVIGVLLVIFGPWKLSQSIRGLFKTRPADPAPEPDPLSVYQAKVDQEQARIRECRAAVAQCQGQLSAWSRQLGDAENDAKDAERRAASFDDQNQPAEARQWFAQMQAKQAQAETLHHELDAAQSRYQADLANLQAAQARLDEYHQDATRLNLELKFSSAELQVSELENRMSSPTDDDGIAAARASVQARIDANEVKTQVNNDLRPDCHNPNELDVKGPATAGDAFAQWQAQRKGAGSSKTSG